MENIDVLNMLVENMSISPKIKNVFRVKGIVTLRDVLNTDYQELCKFRNIGEKFIRELKDYVHSFGYQLLNEKKYLSEEVEERRAIGLTLLEDYDWPTCLCNPLYRIGIYTLDDLYSNKEKIFEIKNFGPKKMKELEKKLLELGVSLYEDEETQVESVVVDGITLDPSKLQAMALENASVRTRIDGKNSLIIAYQHLMAERQALLKREAELNKMITEFFNTLQEVVQGDKHVK